MFGSDYLDALVGVGEKPSTSQVDNGSINENSLSSGVADASVKRIRFYSENRDRKT